MEEAHLRRKIAVILAADVVGFSALVARDEDGALRQLMACRAIFADFAARGGGRIFNTAGDAVLCEFASAVEAVRAAMDIQEALRASGATLPEARRMVFRIGISLGDVVQREGDLLGDGVNIAARLQALAAPGGICISRAVQEQVANKVAVGFRDIGEQMVKNIPHPVHAFMIADASLPDGKAGGRRVASLPAGAGKPFLRRAALGAVIGLAVLLGAGLLAYVKWRKVPSETSAPSIVAASEAAKALPAASPAAVPAPPPSSAAASAAPPSTASSPADPASDAPPAPLQERRTLAGTPLRTADIPFIAAAARAGVERSYLPRPGPKALAVGLSVWAMSDIAPDEDTAKSQALDRCYSRAVEPTACFIYAVGNTIVWDHPEPPIALTGPLAPRYRKVDQVGIEGLPFATDAERRKLLEAYMALETPKALVFGPRGELHDAVRGGSVDDAIRRALQVCADKGRRACLLVAIDGDVVVRVPRLSRVRGLLDIDTGEKLPEPTRQALITASGADGWYAMARGAGGIYGLGSSATGEKEASDAALAACQAKGVGCALYSVGPFLVAYSR